MTRIADLQDRLLRLARRREDEGIYTDANLVEAASARIAELEAEVGRLKHDGFLARVARYFDASELAGSFLSEDGDGGFLAAIHGMTKEIARLRAEALSRAGAVKVELSGNTGELIDKMAEAIRGDTTSDETPSPKETAMTDNIPDEIMREAIKICDPSFSGGTRVNDAQHIVDVARALMARDQRAAGLARRFMKEAEEDEKPGDFDWSQRMASNATAKAISRAILSYDEA